MTLNYLFGRFVFDDNFMTKMFASFRFTTLITMCWNLTTLMTLPLPYPFYHLHTIPNNKIFDYARCFLWGEGVIRAV